MAGDMASLGSDAAERTQFERRAREFETIAAMLRMYCRAHHQPKGAPLCAGCTALHDYARRRLERCVFGEAKPTCANCAVHCYKAVMREHVRQVMRWAGPRMLWRHPVLTVRHILDGRRPTPALQRQR
jgi:Nitrous oxide-stimulated promoter